MVTNKTPPLKLKSAKCFSGGLISDQKFSKCLKVGLISDQNLEGSKSRYLLDFPLESPLKMPIFQNFSPPAGSNFSQNVAKCFEVGLISDQKFTKCFEGGS